jgi:hypothetical protein
VVGAVAINAVINIGVIDIVVVIPVVVSIDIVTFVIYVIGAVAINAVINIAVIDFVIGIPVDIVIDVAVIKIVATPHIVAFCAVALDDAAIEEVVLNSSNYNLQRAALKRLTPRKFRSKSLKNGTFM